MPTVSDGPGGNHYGAPRIERGMSPISTLRRRSAVLALMAAAVVLSGCSSTNGLSAPSTGTTGTTSSSGGGNDSCSALSIGMRSGSVPNPYNYHWSLTLDGDQGSIKAEGSAAGGSPWERSFVADQASRTALCDYARELAQRGLAEGVGGSTAQGEYTPEGGSPVVGKQGVEGSDVPDRMDAALPAGVWADLQQQLDTWANSERTTAAPTTS